MITQTIRGGTMKLHQKSYVTLSVSVAALALGCASESSVSAQGQEALLSSNPTSCPKACTPKTCKTVKPTNPLITDWKDVADSGMFVDNDAYSHPGQSWWESFFGGPYVYPTAEHCSDAAASEYPLTQSIDGTWNVQGSVGTWSGFGLWFAPCTVDLSAYRGISFTIWGDVGETKQLTVNAPTSQNSKPSACLTNVGTCDPAKGECKSAGKLIDIPANQGEPITVLWSDLAGGKPFDGVDPTQILGIHFGFQRVEWGGVTTAPYPVNVTVGTITLVP
jgi:hypothetical protein